MRKIPLTLEEYKERNQIIKDLYKKGAETYETLGKKFKISRQRIHQIITNYKSPCNKKYRTPGTLEYQKKLSYNRRLNKQRYEKYRLKVLTHYGGNPPKCSKCGFDNIDCLEIDHIKNNGAEHRKKLFGSQRGTGTGFYLWLIKNNFPKGYQVLCKNCNWLKYKKHLKKLSTP